MRARFGVLSAQYAQKGIALGVVGALVDDERGFAAPLVNRAGPDKHSGHLQAIQPGVAVMAAVNLKSDHRPAMALCR